MNCRFLNCMQSRRWETPTIDNHRPAFTYVFVKITPWILVYHYNFPFVFMSMQCTIGENLCLNNCILYVLCLCKISPPQCTFKLPYVVEVVVVVVVEVVVEVVVHVVVAAVVHVASSAFICCKGLIYKVVHNITDKGT